MPVHFANLYRDRRIYLGKSRRLGADGFKLTCFHFSSLLIVCRQSLIVFLIYFLNVLVRSLFIIEKLLLKMKSRTFMCLSSRYVITIVIPSSAFNTTAMLDANFLLILLWVCRSFFFFLRVSYCNLRFHCTVYIAVGVVCHLKS